MRNGVTCMARLGTEDPKAGPDPHQKPNETPQKGPKAKARNRPRSAGIGETRFQFFTKTLAHNTVRDGGENGAAAGI